MLYIIALVLIGTFILYYLSLILGYLYIVSGVLCPRGGSFTLLILPAPVVLSIRPSPPPAVLPLSFLYCNLCESLVIPLLDDTSPSSSLLIVLLFPREGRLHQSPVAGRDDVDVVTDAAVVLVLVFFGCPVVFLVGLMYRYLRY
jgi:hypothetical protein